MSFKKMALCALALFAIMFLISRGTSKIERQTRRSKYFSYEKIASQKEYTQSAPLFFGSQKSVEEALSKPFFYLGKGKQCYAFISDDGHYVLKLFQQERLELAKDEKDKLSKEERRNNILNSFELAMSKLPEDSGLVCLHLGKTDKQFGLLTLLDERGTLFQFPLDSVPFALQKKAALLKPTLLSLMSQGKEEEAKRRVEQVFELLLSCAKKGVEDQDGALIRNDNIGFLPDSAIYIDIGKLRTSELSPKELFIKDLERLRPLEKWLEAHFPSLHNYFQGCAQKYEAFL